MTRFYDFLTDRLDESGFSTEDALASFLPLVREVLDEHNAGFVAPLEGLDELHVEGVQIWFEDAKRLEPRMNRDELNRIESHSESAVEIVGQTRRMTDLDEGTEKVVDLSIGQRGEKITRRVYLPGYVAWEHEVGHHDPLTDTFSLGLILASLACGLDLTDPKDLEAFAANRENLFALNPDVHPVVARAIVRMTELDRHRRAQDLPAVLHTLENYRDQEVDFEFDLARIPGFKEKDVTTKQQVVLSKLQERLFEISRRNRLLHFRATMNNLNLTHASIPLSFDIENVRPDQILTWNKKFSKAVLGGKPISLNKYLNFAEALYLPSVLDKVIAEARRDQAEFGFAQLRLVACFLHWANLKEKPIERFESPLVLLPVKLTKKKGIKDTYYLECVDTEAEVNPVIRHQFKQLYDIDLPHSIDLSESDLDTFFEYLSSKIAASESAVSLQKIDKPRIELIHDKARRKLDQYRRRARIAGRGVRTFMDLDYSYDPLNYHPLGIKIFTNKIRPTETRLSAILEERPRPRTYMVAEKDPPVVEKERTFYSVHDASDDNNPYTWGFDLCSVTLANFKYRKMSLVRDYEALTDEPITNPAFDATFSLVPRPVSRDIPTVPPLADRFDVVPCDPTQATSIEEGHAGKSYIIQGPPGTGKSQTITNLIADFIARGKRVLFVCEKRAAIDVVFARLRQVGLDDLCSLIHDSQTDKKQFIMDLKATYESFLADADPLETDDAARQDLLKRLENELHPLEQFDGSMNAEHRHVGVPVRELIARCVRLRDQQPELSPIEKERLPDFASWNAHRDTIVSYTDTLREIQRDSVLAKHPLHVLSPRLAGTDRPLELVTGVVERVLSLLDEIEACLEESSVDRAAWRTTSQLRQLIDYVERIVPLAKIGQMSLVDAEDEKTAEFDKEVRKLRKRRSAVDGAAQKNSAWKEKLPPEELPIAMEQAKTFEAGFLPWLRPSWWRLRGVLERCYNFKSHVIKPTWSQVLNALEKEYQLQSELNDAKRDVAEEFKIDADVEEIAETVRELRERTAELPDWLADVQHELVGRTFLSVGTQSTDKNVRPTVDATAKSILGTGKPLRLMANELHKIADLGDYSLEDLRRDLEAVTRSIEELPDYLHCLSELMGVDQRVSTAIRTLPLTPTQIEAAVAAHSLEEVYRVDRSLARFSSLSRNRHVRQLEQLYDRWLETNAVEIRERVKRRFWEHIHTCGLPASQLTAEQKKFKKRYNRGRRELEHEFGKQMRYKSIRDLVADESGEVVKDLKPVWLMSPLSVSDTLPLDTDHVDVVIFDEASQITLEESVPSLFRATQAIVVGDEMQLPPTDFFSARRSEEEELMVEEDGELVQYDLESNSFLNHAAKNLQSTMLGWHYRSRSESLISFSNWAFYDGRLLTVPEESFSVAERNPLEAQAAEDGAANADELLRRPISFHFMEHGVYEKRRNRAEADYIAQMVRRLLAKQSGVTIGIVAFSEAQQDEIEGALHRLAQEDAEFRDLLDAELEREDDGQFVGLLVKNLENIQGDERDVIIMSICYGPGPTGKMLMNFGPINKSGGEKRLNVAFSRSKHHMVVVSSIRPTDITNDYNDGANCLKNYLRYAEAVSTGDDDVSQRVLYSLSPWRGDEQESNSKRSSDLALQISSALNKLGFQVDRHVGQSHFRCDLAVRRKGEGAYCLGILPDNEEYYQQSDLLERDVMRPKLLRSFGWNVATVLTKDWLEDATGVLERLSNLIETGEEEEEWDVPVTDEPSDEQD